MCIGQYEHNRFKHIVLLFRTAIITKPSEISIDWLDVDSMQQQCQKT